MILAMQKVFISTLAEENRTPALAGFKSARGLMRSHIA